MSDGEQTPPPVPSAGTGNFIDALNAALPQLTGQLARTFEQEQAALLRQAADDRKKKILEIGLVGWLIGDKEHAPTRIAFLVIILATVLIFGCLWMSTYPLRPQADQIIGNVVTGAIGLLTLALGYIFGRHQSE